MNKVMVDVGKVDWSLLRKQKLTLVEMLMRKPLSDEIIGAIEGILSLLDDVQDQAEKQLGEQTVFGGSNGG